MSKPVNLNRFRKERSRAEARVQADRNAVQHGRTKAEKERDQAQAEKARRDLDGRKRET